MEKTSSFSLADFVGFLFFNRILYWVLRFQKYYSRFFVLVRWEDSSSNQQLFCFDAEEDDGKMSKEDVVLLMKNMGISCVSEGEQLKDFLRLNDLSQLFDEKEPSLEEVKAAFDVFDENKDGFIGAEDLQRVLSNLGFKEGSSADQCEEMIRAFDDKGARRLDFNEFVKLMENSFC